MKQKLGKASENQVICHSLNLHIKSRASRIIKKYVPTDLRRRSWGQGIRDASYSHSLPIAERLILWQIKISTVIVTHAAVHT